MVSRLNSRGATHLHSQVGMHKHLKLPGLLVLVRDHYGRAQAAPLQGDTVDEVELVGPQGLDTVVERGAAKSKVELDGQVGRGGVVGRLAGALAQELPPRRARKAVLGKFGGDGVIGGGAEDL